MTVQPERPLAAQKLHPAPLIGISMASWGPTAAAAAAAHQHSLRLCWRRLGRRDSALAASGLAFLLLALALTVGAWLLQGLARELEPLLTSSSGLVFVDLTLVRGAEEKGAVCLDGSPPAYHLHRGFGSGSDNWVVHLEGGGWCDTVASCSSRKGKPLGSSHYMERQLPFYGILSHVPSQNPDFYNWNRVKVRYCDGASFSGNVESEIQNGTKIFFRGQRIWEAVMDELLSKGLANAKKALLTGCSAGGLATFIHCESFRALLPEKVTVKCFADGGFFLDIEDISGKRTMRDFYKDVVLLQDVAKNLQKNCVSREEPSQCFFPREIIKNVNTPLFILNAAYDWWQIQHVLAPGKSDPQQKWLRCRLNIRNCDPSQMESLHGFRNAMLNALSVFQNKKGGMFIDSCFLHCQTANTITWHSPNSPRINNKTIAEAVGDWYFDRREVQEIDCAYPCNPTCYHMDFS